MSTASGLILKGTKSLDLRCDDKHNTYCNYYYHYRYYYYYYYYY